MLIKSSKQQRPTWVDYQQQNKDALNDLKNPGGIDEQTKAFRKQLDEERLKKVGYWSQRPPTPCV